MKIRPLRAELFHANGRTDMTLLTVSFPNFANAPSNRYLNSTEMFKVNNCVLMNSQNIFSRFYTAFGNALTL